MYWLRQHLPTIALTVSSAHLAAFAVASIALCCQKNAHHITETTSCPMHRTADETCSIAHCPMHRAAGDNTGTHTNHGPHRFASQHQSPSSPIAECSDEESPLALLLGTPAILNTDPIPHSPGLGLNVQPRLIEPPGRKPPVIPPPPLV